MRWLIFLIAFSGTGTAAMTLLEKVGMNIWLSRGVGALVAGITGIVIYKWLLAGK